MSAGLVVCSACNREVHQNGPDHTWMHCEDYTPRCEGATIKFPGTRDAIVGSFCGADDDSGRFGPYRVTTVGGRLMGSTSTATAAPKRRERRKGVFRSFR